MTLRQVNFRAEEEIVEIFEAAAARSKMSLTAWLTSVGLTAAGRTELWEQLERVAPRKRAKKRR